MTSRLIRSAFACPPVPLPPPGAAPEEAPPGRILAGPAPEAVSAERSGAFDWRRFAGSEIHVIIPEYPMFQVWQGLYTQAKEFEKVTGIRAHLQTLSSDVYNCFIGPNLALPKGKGDVDVFIAPLDKTGYTLFKSGLIQELDSLLADPTMTEPDYDFSDFFEPFAQVAKLGSTLYSIPALFEAYILIYNKQLVKQHLDGKLPETMEELISAAEKVSARGREWHTYGAMMRGAYSASIIDTVTGVVFNSFGLDPASLPYNLWFDGAWQNPQIVLPDIMEGLHQYARLLRAGPMDSRVINWQEAASMFDQNRVMFFIDASQFEVYFEDPGSYVMNNAGYALLPPVEKGGKSCTGFWQLGYMIPQNVAAVGPAWYFVQYMSTRRSDALMGLYTAGPTRKSSWRDPYFVRTLNRQYYEVVLQALETARTTTVQNVKWDAMAKALVCAILHMADGEPPEKSCAEAQAKILKIVNGEPYDADCPKLPPGMRNFFLTL